MSVNLLSKYRAELMGVSMLMIMLFHTIGGLPVPGLPNIKPFICFDFGVEFFIVLSALGCTYSLAKNGNAVQFYKRRLWRIIPAFVIVATIDFILHDIVLTAPPHNYLALIKNLTFVSFFEGDITFWFILYIMICYLLTPWAFSWTKSSKFICVIAIATIALFTICFYTGYHNVLVYRIPIFFIALIWVSYAQNNTRSFNFLTLGLVTAVVYASLLLFIRYPYKYLFYLIAAIPCLIFLAMMMDRIGKKRILAPLSFIGGISLELYLIHEKTLYFSDMISTNVAFRIIFSFTIAIVLSYLLHMALGKLFLSRSTIKNNIARL